MSEIVQNDLSYRSEIIDCESAKQRFQRNLPQKPYCTDDLTYGLKVRPRENALRCEYIQLNGKLRFYLPFDIDREGAAFAWEDAGLPAPTVIIVNPQNAHAHLLYELSHPVAFKDRNGNGNARNAPIRFYEAMYRGMVEKLDGDRAFGQMTCKNPWHSRWETIWHDSGSGQSRPISHVNRLSSIPVDRILTTHRKPVQASFRTAVFPFQIPH